MEPGLFVGFRFDAPEVRANYDGASLTRGSARAVIAGEEYVSDGECFVRPGGYYSFGSFSPPWTRVLSSTPGGWHSWSTTWLWWSCGGRAVSWWKGPPWPRLEVKMKPA